MKIRFTKLALFLVLFGLGTDQFVKADLESDTQQLFNLAEQNFSQNFNPPLNIQQSPPDWPFYRGPYNNNIFMGVNSDGFVYVLGGSFGNVPVRVGTVQEILATLQDINSLACTGNSNLAMIWALLERGAFLNPRQPPVPGVGWVNYTHPNFPLLSFLYPPDWTPFTFADGQDVGVDLVRTDNGGIYHNFVTSDQTNLTAQQWENWSVNRALNIMNATGTATILCSLPTITQEIAPGLVQTSTAAVVVTNDTLVVSSVSLKAVNGLFGNNVAIITLGGRTNEFNRLADDVFFPIHFQLLVGRSPLIDTDMDGTPDVDDNAPDDPNVQ